MLNLIHEFFIYQGEPIARSSEECMTELQRSGYTFNQSRGILGLAVARGYIKCIEDNRRIKVYIA